MRNFYCLLLLVFLFSCHKEEIKPITHPRFSIAFVQDIDETGVQFAANVYDLGSEQILEHGFVFDLSPDPRFDNSEWVKQEGSPKEFFEMKAEHSMIEGKRYFVAAYMKTPKSVIYSKPVDFVSSGSVGFIFEGMDIPEEVYFEDEITIYGKNIGRNKSNYEFFVVGERGTVEELGEESIKVKLPFLFTFPEDRLSYELTFKNLDKTFTVNKNLNFREPEFEENAPLYDFRDTIRIKGQNLRTKNAFITFRDGTLQNRIPVLDVTDNEIAFLPKAIFNSYTPDFKLYIRGKEYDKTGKIKFIPTNVSNRTFEITTSIPFDLEGENFNPFYPHIHRLIRENGEVESYGLESREKQKLTVKIIDHGQLKREMVYRLQTFGEQSSNPVRVVFKDAYLKHTRVPVDFYSQFTGPWPKAVSFENGGYIFTQNNVFQMNPKQHRVEAIVHIENIYTLAGVFAKKNPQGEIYLGGMDRNGVKQLYRFDPVGPRVVSLAELPGNNLSPKAVFITERYLYYEGYPYINNDGEEVEENCFRYDLSTGQREELDKRFVGNELGVNLKSFYYKGELYGLTRSHLSGNSQLQKFDPVAEVWMVLKSYSSFLDVRSSELFIVKEFAYGLGERDFRINMQNFQVEYVTNSKIHTSLSPIVFHSEGKFYQYAPFIENYFLEFDPDYFEF